MDRRHHHLRHCRGGDGGLVSIWFVVGAVAALVATELGAALWLQVGLFLIVSILALIATRPLVRKMLDKISCPRMPTVC